MPVETVQLWPGRNLDQKRALVAAITDAMIEDAGADLSGLHVILQEVPPDNRARGGLLGSIAKAIRRNRASSAYITCCSR